MKLIDLLAIAMAVTTVVSFTLSSFSDTCNLVLSALLLHCGLSSAYAVPSLLVTDEGLLKEGLDMIRRQDTGEDASTTLDPVTTADTTATIEPTTTIDATATATPTSTSGDDSESTEGNKPMGNSTMPGHCHPHHGHKPPKPGKPGKPMLLIRHPKGHGNSTNPCHGPYPPKGCCHPPKPKPPCPPGANSTQPGTSGKSKGKGKCQNTTSSDTGLDVGMDTGSIDGSTGDGSGGMKARLSTSGRARVRNVMDVYEALALADTEA